MPIYSSDPIVRRAPALQLTADARSPLVGVSPTSRRASASTRPAGARGAMWVRVSQGEASAVLPARVDATLAANAVRVAAGHPSTATLGAMFGAVDVEKAARPADAPAATARRARRQGCAGLEQSSFAAYPAA